MCGCWYLQVRSPPSNCPSIADLSFRGVSNHKIRKANQRTLMEQGQEMGEQEYLMPSEIAAADRVHEKNYEVDRKSPAVSELEGSPASSRPPSYSEVSA